jgi:hypothetical protein
VGFAHGRVVKAPGLHSKGVGSISPKRHLFILLSKFLKIFVYPYFYAGNTMTLLFFHENFWKNLKKDVDDSESGKRFRASGMCAVDKINPIGVFFRTNFGSQIHVKIKKIAPF